MSTLPPLPRSNFLFSENGDWSSKPWHASSTPYLVDKDSKNNNEDDDDVDDDELEKVFMKEDMDGFCEKFQDFLYGGITLQRISPRKREKRTLWLYSPQQGSLRIGFVSKLFSATSRTTHLSTSLIQDVSTKSNAGGGGGGASTISDMEGDEVTLDSALMVRTAWTSDDIAFCVCMFLLLTILPFLVDVG
jgi:hypothetical protein